MSFYHEIVKYYEAIFPLKEVKEDFVREMLVSNNYNSLLDIGCATGALCGSMAKHLDRVKGFDLDEANVKRAKMFYKYNNMEFKVGDMLKIETLYPNEEFDAISCFGNTLVHVGKENVPSMFKTVYEKLTEGGTFVLQILNYDYIFEKAITELPLIDNEVIRFDRFYHYETDEVLDFETILTIKETGEALKNTIPLYPIRKAEVDMWLKNAGWSEIAYYKNYKGDTYDGQHIPLIVVAKKV